MKNPTPKTKLYEVEVWMQPEETCFVRVTTKGGAVWLIPIKALIDYTHAYYEEYGWYDESEVGRGKNCRARKQPTGKRLRAIMAANVDPEQWAKEAYWPRIRDAAIHVSGKGEPESDDLWSVEETGGTFEFVTTLTPQQQRQSDYVLWSNTDPAKWAQEQSCESK